MHTALNKSNTFDIQLLAMGQHTIMDIIIITQTKSMKIIRIRQSLMSWLKHEYTHNQEIQSKNNSKMHIKYHRNLIAIVLKQLSLTYKLLMRVQNI